MEFAVQGSRSMLPRFVASFGEPLHTMVSEEADVVEDVEDNSGSTGGSSRMPGVVDTVS